MPLIKLKTIDEAVKHLKAGDIVIYPTETAYALGADATNSDAIQKIYELKGRAFRKPLSIIVSSINLAKQYCHFTLFIEHVARRYWPGPLTMVLPNGHRRLSKLLNSKDNTVAIRVPDSQVARELVRRLGKPIVATSANKSGEQNSYSVHALSRAFRTIAPPVYLLSVGTLPRRKTSTVVRIHGKKIIVLRSGSITVSLPS